MKKSVSIVLSCVTAAACFAVVFGLMISTGKINVSEIAPLDALADMFRAPETVKGNFEALNVATKVNVPENSYISPSNVCVYDGYAYVSDSTGDKVYKVSMTDKTVAAAYTADEQVNSVYVENNKVYIMEGQLAGNLVITDTSFGGKTVIPVGHTPSDIAIRGTTAYVANRFSNTVSVINLSNNTVISTVNVGREPMAIAVAGNDIYVTSHLPEDDATGSFVSADIYVISCASNTVTATIPLTNGAGSVKDIVASSDGSRAYVTDIISRYGYPTTQLDRGWINTNAVSVIDTASKTCICSVLLDDVDLGASNPWGIGISENGSKLVVAASGTHEAVVIDLTEMNRRINAVKNGNGLVTSLDRIADYVPFLDGIKTRAALPGNSPRGLCVSGNTVCFAEYFTGDIAVLDLSDNTSSKISLGTQPAADDVREGNILFFDATYCYQQWQSCNSCHPDARADGFNWDNMNDGLGNPKSTKSMLYSHRTPPVMVTGIRATAEIAVKAGMKYIEFNNLDNESMEKIDEYLKALQPEQSPYLNRDGSLTESAERGKEIFRTEGCVTCHPAPLYTDLTLHSSVLETEVDGWENRPLDTPTLVEVWRTGPWHFNGMFDTMFASSKHDAPSLTDSQLNDLTEYVMSIGAENEYYGVEQVFSTNISGETEYTKLSAGATINSVSIRKQLATDSPARVTVELYDSNGTKLDSCEKTLEAMQLNTAVTINFSDDEMVVPATLSHGAYLVISIDDASNGSSLATDLRIIY